MKETVRRIFVEKKDEFAVEAQSLLNDLKDNLGIKGITRIRYINRYDVSGISEEEYTNARNSIFSEPPVDVVYDEVLVVKPDDSIICVELLPGQYDQRADSAAQCLQILTQKERPEIRNAKMFVLEGLVSPEEMTRIKRYIINPLEAREASLEKPMTLHQDMPIPEDVATVDGFIHMEEAELKGFMDSMGFAMNYEDLQFCQKYFKDTEKRNPTITELRVIDTYWSDHCRHTTFLTTIETLEIEDGEFSAPIKAGLEGYMNARAKVFGIKERDINLMDMATIGAKEMRTAGLLDDMEISDEINACSVTIPVDVNGSSEEWLLMFKNETHNHPTEIEPFGGAATCLGGAIRDPLSGRSYVYGAMRVTGSGDPRTKIEDTILGKLPQRKITTGAASGYSAYGNQIGLATGHVAEVYDEDFAAKRMEVGAVLGAAPKANVIREIPEIGDIIVLLGGKTGRDGCGGATGSSKEHTEDSLRSCGAEVQKGNPPTERKIQRLFRNSEVAKMIKKCNDFGAGGVSVAIGELAAGLNIDLEAVPKKYDGLDGTELAISESQERMAVVVSPENVEKLVYHAHEENLEATVVAVVTDTNRLKMTWRGKTIVDLDRSFLDTNGVKQKIDVKIMSPENETYFDKQDIKINEKIDNISKAWLQNMSDLNVCSQKGLVERFDSTIGAGTVLMPFGGVKQRTPVDGLAMKIPVLHGETTAVSLMTFGYNPKIGKWSPFHGAYYAVIDSVAKLVAMGGDHRKVRLTFQEYFEKLGKSPEKWGKPSAALLGALKAQRELGIPAIGGKDSMSGTFKDINVPPTLISFAVGMTKLDKVISPEIKKGNSKVFMLKAARGKDGLPDTARVLKNFDKFIELRDRGVIRSASSVRYGGVAAAVTKMCFGNDMGIRFAADIDPAEMFRDYSGSILLEVPKDLIGAEIFEDLDWQFIGMTQSIPSINIKGKEIEVRDALIAWSQPLERVFPTKTTEINAEIPSGVYLGRNTKKANMKLARPRVFIPVFPGTNCEYDSARAFEKAGAIVETVIFKNLTPKDIEESIKYMEKVINDSQIIMLPGGFSGGDEPDGSGKFIATAFRNPRLKYAIMSMLKERDGLMLGICNGFQALIKLGLLPYGEIRDLDPINPTLTYNKIGRHVSGIARTKVVSTISPWLARTNLGDVHNVAISHGEGRFAASIDFIEALRQKGQIATQYVDLDDNPTYDISFNPNGSTYAIEGITSPDGKVFGKMAHSERLSDGTYKNIKGPKDQHLFKSGVEYFL